MNEQELKKKSKFLSLILRHQPETVGITLDESGWVDVDILLAAMSQQGKGMSRATLDTVVQSNDKQRFSFNADGTRIRANQGHSISVDLGYTTAVPPRDPVSWHSREIYRTHFPGRAQKNESASRASACGRADQHCRRSQTRQTGVTESPGAGNASGRLRILCHTKPGLADR